MYLKHLSLTNYRNYEQLELDFPCPLTLLYGTNAQGKTNLLEAIYFLATSRSPQARADRDMISWSVEDTPMPFARLVAEAEMDGRGLKIELAVAPSNASNGTLCFRKQIRINGTPRRAIDLVGQLKVVLFLPQDISLVAGSPAGRRHYLDVALCQIDRDYCRHLSQFNRLLPRRNNLLRQLAERGGDPAQLDFWDERLAEHGGIIVSRRGHAVSILADHVAHIHAELTGGSETLELSYAPSGPYESDSPSARPISEAYQARLRETRQRELAAGATLVGPHRDDLRFTIQGRDLQQYGSRGQQRTASMSLKLAEVELMAGETGESPILLLDDIMSELDSHRRRYLGQFLLNAGQAVITTTDLEDYEPDLLGRASLWQVTDGRIVEPDTPS